VRAGTAIVAFVPSTDLERSRRFYVDILGLELIELSPYACVLNGLGATLRVTKVDNLAPHPFTVLGWEVTDIRASIADLTTSGVTFLRYDGMPQDEVGIWTAPGGGLIAWFADPDANVLSFSQLS